MDTAFKLYRAISRTFNTVRKQRPLEIFQLTTELYK